MSVIGVDVAALLVAFLVTVLELTEVVALVFALSADAGSIRHGALGATAGVAVVGLAALGTGAAILAVPHEALLWGSAVLLTGFGVFLFRSTLRTYRRAREAAAGAPVPPKPHAALQFAGGFTVGAVETTEAVVVLLAITAAGEGTAAVLGAVAGGVCLVVAAAVVHERIRRIKTAWLKLGATSLIFTFAAFWAGEAVGYAWPGSDLALVPMFVVALVLVRGAIGGFLKRASPPVPAG